MGTDAEMRANQKNHLQALLDIKAANKGKIVNNLDDAIKRAITPMNQEDIAWVEKVVGIKIIE